MPSISNRRKPVGLPKASTTHSYPTAHAAVKELERRHGKRAGLWTYHDSAGQPCMVVVRFDGKNGKSFRPIHRTATGRWEIGSPAKPRPLYRLHELEHRDLVLVLEGEKATDVAAALGFAATTSLSGAKAAAQTDWTPLTGKTVVIMPDNDGPGRQYAADVKGILEKLNPPAKVKVVELPGLPPKGDIADWVAARGGKPVGEVADELAELIDAAPASSTPTSATKPLMEWNHPSRLADAFAAVHKIRVVKRTLYVFRGDHYATIGDESLEDLAWQVCEQQAIAEHDRLRQVDPTVNVPKFGIGTATSLMRAARSRVRLPEETKLDTWIGPDSGNVLSVANGLLLPDRRTLLPHTPDWFSVTSIPARFDPKAKPPAKWLGVLSELLEGDADRIATIQEVFGVCLDRNVTFKHIVALTGEGENGKSVVFTAIRALLGGRNLASTSIRRIAQDKFALFGLYGKLANVVGDEGFFESTDEATLKAITGEDMVTFEDKYRSGFVDVNRCKVVFSCNALPRFSDRSEGMWNRLMVVPFTYTVPDSKKNPDLLKPAYWHDELPGMLNWALDGLARFRENRHLTLSLASHRAGDAARLDAQHHRRFLMEHYEFVPGQHVQGQNIYDEYRNWMKSQGLERSTISQPCFLKEIGKVLLGAESKPKRVDGVLTRVWEGVARRPGVTPVTPSYSSAGPKPYRSSA